MAAGCCCRKLDGLAKAGPGSRRQIASLSLASLLAVHAEAANRRSKSGAGFVDLIDPVDA
jgi:hypothetical protein